MTRVILDCDDDADLSQCLTMARDALRQGEAGDAWGHWAQHDPDFSALIRFNKSSVSVRGSRKVQADLLLDPQSKAPHATADGKSCGEGSRA